MTDKRIVLRDVTTTECRWLDEDVKAGSVVYLYHNNTYGCIGPKGVAVSLAAPGGKQEPFFELPIDALELGC